MFADLRSTRGTRKSCSGMACKDVWGHLMDDAEGSVEGRVDGLFYWKIT